MITIASQITSLTVVYSIVYSDADERKHQSSASLAFVWGIHRDRWIPRTKDQLRGKCFHLMTSSCNSTSVPYALYMHNQCSISDCWCNLFSISSYVVNDILTNTLYMIWILVYDNRGSYEGIHLINDYMIIILLICCYFVYCLQLSAQNIFTEDNSIFMVILNKEYKTQNLDGLD